MPFNRKGRAFSGERTHPPPRGTFGEQGADEPTSGQIRTAQVALLFSLLLYAALVLIHTPVICLGHVALSSLPVPEPLTPFMQAYTTASFRSTMGLAALGSMTVLAPLCIGTTGWMLSTVGTTWTRATMSTSARMHFPVPLPSVNKYVLWQAWMISAGPVGSLLYKWRNPSLAKFTLGAGHAALAALAGELIVVVLSYMRRRVRDDAAGAELEAEVEQIVMEEGQTVK